MNELDVWLKKIESWYKNRKHDQVEALRQLILSPPEKVWGPKITDQQSKAIACWLDGCLRIYQFHQHHQQPDNAYQYLMFAYSKLQAVACDAESQPELADWSLKRIQHLCVLALELSNQQQSSHWGTQAQELIEAHVQFMASIAQKHDQGIQTHRLQ
ncbi:transcriptional regulator [Vibrio makurazakiensis]|uniref:transcriptional regulator n=1 Tax=Vibrio makurazakiensis TaxID=2910250 RepID=UPI003D0A1C13